MHKSLYIVAKSVFELTIDGKPVYTQLMLFVDAYSLQATNNQQPTTNNQQPTTNNQQRLPFCKMRVP